MFFDLKLIFINIIFSLELLVEKGIQVFIELNEDLFEGIIENKIIIKQKTSQEWDKTEEKNKMWNKSSLSHSKY